MKMVNYNVHDPNDHRAKAVMLLDGILKRRYEYNADGTIKYLGEAVEVDALTSELKWRIKEFTYVNSQVTEENYADGSNQFNKEYDERATYTYS